ncbi:hypothetical protein SH1V18_30990 [Vallitalea longa]|uniref:GH18 domain-containing protein n=1 Tax=Vallitalea longa TaxID=2936439 RepID=A0A9W6DH92_9FIRM|nr:glycosyl hydrolase family 18 protein [Vallitalea longa]GKX30619.1 hypothetical protein SH1V18_30990 [Vallitalea longa]
MRKSVKVVMVLMLIALIGFFAYHYIIDMLPNFEQANIEEILPKYQKGRISVIVEDRNIETDYSPEFVDEVLYLPVNLINEYIDPYYYWDEKEVTLTYTTKNKVIRMKNDDLTYFVNNEPLQLDMPIKTFKTDMAYVPVDFIMQFSHIQSEYNKDLNILTIDYVDNKYQTSNVAKEKAYIRIDTSEKSKVVEKLSTNDQLRVYEQIPDGWVKVRSKSGLIGYMKRNDLGAIKDIYPNLEKLQEEPEYNNNKNVEGLINIAWDNIGHIDANNYIKDRLEGVKGLDVISPTWFSIKNSEGDISNIGSNEYVKYVKSQGYQVWALFKNEFNKKITHDVLSSTEKREKVIKQILALASIYNLDGINIDFENVAKEDGVYFVQFIREITPYLKEQGLVVSVDTYVPSAWTAHYNRTEIGKVVDYVIIMAYDEHWSTSEESGSVASIGFVENGLLDTLKEVQKEKVILGLPYYTRLWREEETDGIVNVTSKAYSMDRARKKMDDNDVELVWNDDVKQYYGDYKEDNIVYKMWLEDERSIEEKVKLAIDNEIAGVSGWTIGLAKDKVWDVLVDYLKK